MIVKTHLSGLRATRWYEYAIRFATGGAITVIAGLIAQKWGPGVGGLFLAFPAIFPASATLVETHERQRKEQKGLRGELRGMNAAAVDAAGAAIGSPGLIAFAAACAGGLPRYPAGLVLAAATVVWALVAFSGWFIQRRGFRLFQVSRTGQGAR